MCFGPGLMSCFLGQRVCGVQTLQEGEAVRGQHLLSNLQGRDCSCRWTGWDDSSKLKMVQWDSKSVICASEEETNQTWQTDFFVFLPNRIWSHKCRQLLLQGRGRLRAAFSVLRGSQRQSHLICHQRTRWEKQTHAASCCLPEVPAFWRDALG